MKTIQDMHNDLDNFKEQAKTLATKANDSTEAYKQVQTVWKKLFGCALDRESAEGFVRHFRGATPSKKQSRKRQRKQRGGMAPIAYQMGPGVPSAMTYGNFTTDVSKDATSQHDLDVYFNSGMSRTAGTESWRFPTVPAGMGSNQVGGKRSTRRNRSRKQKGGGSLLQTIGQIPFNASVPPSMIQTAYSSWSGQPSAPSSDVTSSTWKYSTPDTTINPAVVTRIGDSIGQLATPAPWK